MTQVSQLQWGTHSDCDSIDVQSSGDNKHIKISGEVKAILCS